MIQHSEGYFELTDFDIKPFKIDLESHYNDDFQEIHKINHQFINDQREKRTCFASWGVWLG